MKKIVGLILIGFIFTGCDPQIGYEYYLNNQSDSILNIYCRGLYSGGNTLQVLPKKEIMLYQIFLLGRDPHDEDSAFLKVFDTLTIRTESMIPVKTDIYNRKYWTYDNDIYYCGIIKTGTNKYKLKLTNEDFQ